MKRIVFMLTLLLPLLSGQWLSAQTKDSVNGSVVDKYGEPLPAAEQVLVRGQEGFPGLDDMVHLIDMIKID